MTMDEQWRGEAGGVATEGQRETRMVLADTFRNLSGSGRILQNHNRPRVCHCQFLFFPSPGHLRQPEETPEDMRFGPER